MLLAIKDLVKAFGPNPAVDDVSFAVEKPQMIGVIGRSGAGKSTLLRMMNRLADATEGSITFDGQRDDDAEGRGAPPGPGSRAAR
jgi:phosphonate transport system ATP-binding protein